jgi:hypothetical protein
MNGMTDTSTATEDRYTLFEEMIIWLLFSSGAGGLYRGRPAQPTTASLGTHLQLGQAPSVLGLPHPTRIPELVETISQKGKVSLIYWTNTLT